MKKVILVPQYEWNQYTIDSMEAQTHNKPITSPLYFENSNPLQIEIGSGNGHFLVHQALHNLDKNFVGIELKNKRIHKSIRKTKTHGLENLKWIRGDARQILASCFLPDSIDHIYVNFPDPWPKKKHLKHRMIQPAFIQWVYYALKPGHRITLATDHMEYFAWMLLYFEQSQLFRFCFPSYFTLVYPGYYPTLYEQRWREEGRLIGYSELEKKQ